MADLILTKRKCGEQHGRFYDCRGDYFRCGVDTRNHVGRFVKKVRGRLKIDPDVTDKPEEIPGVKQILIHAAVQIGKRIYG